MPAHSDTTPHPSLQRQPGDAPVTLPHTTAYSFAATNHRINECAKLFVRDCFHYPFVHLAGALPPRAGTRRRGFRNETSRRLVSSDVRQRAGPHA